MTTPVRLVAAGVASRTAGLAANRFVERLYEGGAKPDAVDYREAGHRVAAHLRRGQVGAARRAARTVPYDTRDRGTTATSFVRFFTGVVEWATGSPRAGAEAAHATLGLAGLLAFDRAFRRAVPDGDAHGYSRALLLTPSLVLWPSAVGKEAWMVFGFGTASLGGARVTTGSPRSGTALAALGAAAVLLVRPGLVTMLWTGQRGDIARRTREGGSAYDPPDRGTPRGAAAALATVLFRPHPLEAHNAQTVAAALESALLAAMTLRRLGSLVAAARLARRRPYVAYCATLTAALAAILSPTANFGLLVRQRTPILPFYLALLFASPDRR